MELSDKDRKRLSDLFARLAEKGPEAETAARKIGDIAARLGISGGDLRTVFLRGFNDDVREYPHHQNQYTGDEKTPSHSKSSKVFSDTMKFFLLFIGALVIYRFFTDSNISIIWNVISSSMYVVLGFVVWIILVFLVGIVRA